VDKERARAKSGNSSYLKLPEVVTLADAIHGWEGSMTAAPNAIIMVLVIVLFIIALIALAQLNCFIERRRELGRREIQNLKAQRKQVASAAAE
jgi:hypothetical protein